uniref:SWIB/MDM2 domain protein n=1 Tax=Mycena chlorophos TaxID=658473 RepID=A0ABQ0M3B2_MYCCL|nr:SWIB/MDM2 domain protein [Mycena chlorophos]
MSLDAATLEPYIEEILSAPGTDLTTISAKRVRKQLHHIDPALTPELLKENREVVDSIIAGVFERVQGQMQAVDQDHDSDEDQPASMARTRVENTDSDDATPPPSKKSKKSSQELSDAELARQLSSEINGRTRRSNNGSSRPKASSSANSSPRKRKPKKSAAMVDSESDDDDDSVDAKPSKKKRATREGGSARGGFAKPYLLSEPLAAVLGVESLSRPQVVKQLWVYIKANELQNPKNKREIVCDSLLRPVFNADKIDMFKMNKVLGSHLHEFEG